MCCTPAPALRVCQPHIPSVAVVWRRSRRLLPPPAAASGTASDSLVIGFALQPWTLTVERTPKLTVLEVIGILCGLVIGVFGAAKVRFTTCCTVEGPDSFTDSLWPPSLVYDVIAAM